MRAEGGGEVWFSFVCAGANSGMPMATGYALYGYGILAEARGDLATARAWFERSLVIDEQVNERHDVLNDHIFLGSLCVALGDVDAARLHCAAIADLASSNPGRREVAARERLLGEIALAEGRLDEGRRHLVESMRVLSSTKMTDFFLSTLDVLIRAAPPQTQATLAAVAEDVRGGRVPMPEAVSVIEHTSGTTTS